MLKATAEVFFFLIGKRVMNNCDSVNVALVLAIVALCSGALQVKTQQILA